MSDPNDSRSGDRSHHLADLSYEQAQSILERGAIGLLPAGSTEAHGPHLPLSTDVVIAETGAERAARLLEARGVAAAVLPPLPYAVTEYAAQFSGTLSFPEETARAMVRDAILAAMRAGFRAVVVCNAHLEPAQIAALHAAVQEANDRGARATFPDVTRKPHALRLGEEFKSGACHAGSYETSLVMAARPFLVHRETAEGLAPNPESLAKAIRDGKRTFLEAGGPRAYFGYPAEATDAEGDMLYDEMADIFATAGAELAAVRARPGPEPG